MFHENDNPCLAAAEYAAILPENPDIILLGLGDDGHIASLFPGTQWQVSGGKKVTTAISPISGMQRVSITKDVLDSAFEIIVFASGQNKREILTMLNEEKGIKALPASIALRGLWLLDESTAKGIFNKEMQ